MDVLKGEGKPLTVVDSNVQDIFATSLLMFYNMVGHSRWVNVTTNMLKSHTSCNLIGMFCGVFFGNCC